MASATASLEWEAHVTSMWSTSWGRHSLRSWIAGAALRVDWTHMRRRPKGHEFITRCGRVPGPTVTRLLTLKRWNEMTPWQRHCLTDSLLPRGLEWQTGWGWYGLVHVHMAYIIHDTGISYSLQSESVSGEFHGKLAPGSHHSYFAAGKPNVHEICSCLYHGDLTCLTSSIHEQQ